MSGKRVRQPVSPKLTRARGEARVLLIQGTPEQREEKGRTEMCVCVM